MKNSKSVIRKALVVLVIPVILFSGCDKKDAAAPAPTISGFSPEEGIIGTTVTISGTNFSTTPASNVVKFNGTLATVTAATNTTLTTTVPAAATTGTITVTVNGQTASSTTDFSVTPVTTSYSNDGAWNCTNGTNCQGLYQIDCQQGSTITITVDNVVSGSIARIALYAPGVTTGGVNLLTTDLSTKELLCSTMTSGCSSVSTEGYSGFVTPSSGIYTVAVTRDDGKSCGHSGTYTLTVTSDKGFAFKSKTDDTASAATGIQCP